jgi:diguanylate cyclase (GGDEF)-like protein
MFQNHDVYVTAGLGGIGCRRDLDRKFVDLVKRSSPSQRAAIILVDIDFFGNYQFACGIAACDQCLDAVADCLLETTRRFGATTYAYDTGRFAILLPDADELLAERLAREIHFQVGGLVIEHPRSPLSRSISVSVGLAVGRADSQKAAQLLQQEAEAALLSAQNAGRDRVIRRSRAVCV